MHRNGNISRVRLNRQLQLAGHVAESARVQVDERLGEHDAGQHDRPGREEQHADDVRREAPDGAAVAGRERAGERRHERRAERAFGKEIAEDVGMRNAMRKASIASPAPKKYART